MSGFMIVMAPCACCRRVFSFNSQHVPSVRRSVGAEREPVCRECIERANPERVRRGLQPFEIHPNAYEPELA